MNITGSSPGSKARRKKWLRRGFSLALFLLMPVLLFMLVKNLQWQDLKSALRSYDAMTLTLASLASIAGYAAYCSFDLLARFYTRHNLPTRQIIPVVFVCYTFNLNIGAWLGGIALRYRLYSRLGLRTSVITKIFSFSFITNWLGYIAISGVVFSMRLIDLPPDWSLGTSSLQVIGFGLLVATAVYLLACRLSKRRVWHIGKHPLTLPSLRLALIQTLLGALNWALMALLIYILLPEQAYFPSILSVLLISSMASAMAHIPAGLGVIEAVFLALLQHQFSQSALLAALIGYRVLYFLLPLALACVVYLVLEKRAKKLRSQRTTDNAHADDLNHLPAQETR